MNFLTMAFRSMVHIAGGVEKSARVCGVSSAAISNYQRGIRKIPGQVMHALNDHLCTIKPGSRLDCVKAAHKESSEAIQAGMGASTSEVAKETTEAYSALWLQLHSVRQYGEMH